MLHLKKESEHRARGQTIYSHYSQMKHAELFSGDGRCVTMSLTLHTTEIWLSTVTDSGGMKDRTHGIFLQNDSGRENTDTEQPVHKWVSCHVKWPSAEGGWGCDLWGSPWGRWAGGEHFRDGTGRDGTGASPLSLQLEFDCEAERDRTCPAPRLQAFCCSNPTRQHRPGWMFSHQWCNPSTARLRLSTRHTRPRHLP